jgi:hypothetical protein
MEPTVYKAALYHPDESQIITCGTNFKIACRSNPISASRLGGSWRPFVI